MMDQNKSKQQLLEELAEMRRRVAALESAGSERERAEEVLQQSESGFRSLFQESPVGAVVVTPNGQFVQVNRAFCDFLGCLECELVGQAVLSITHPDDRETSSTAIRQAAESGPRIERLEKRYLHKSGQVVWGEVSSTLICDAEGKSIYLIAQVLDITERKRAEERLRNSERTLRTLIDANPESIVLLDAEGAALIVNETAARRLGKTVDEIVGQKIYTIVPPEVGAQRVKRLQEVVRTGKAIRFENQRSERYFEITMHPILDEKGKVASVAVLAIDRTDSKRAEAALQRAHDELERRVDERTAELAEANHQLQREVAKRTASEEKYRTLVETLPDAVIMADLAGRATFVSRRFLELHRAESADEFLGKTAWDYLVPEEHEKANLYYQKTLSDGIARGVELSFFRKDGTRFPSELSSALVKDASGKAVAIINVMRDITERKQAEDALRQSRDQLKAVYDGMSDGLLIADIETKRFVRANASICRMLGYSKEELLTLSVRDIHPEADLPFVVGQFEALVEGKIRVSEDVPVRRKDGGVFYAVVSSSAVDYDNRPCAAGFFRDSTERRQAEEALRKSEARFRSYYEQGLMGMAVSNTNAQWTDVNDHFCEIFGSSREEILRQKISRCHN
jgi:PAS domain S-box-containing protein